MSVNEEEVLNDVEVEQENFEQQETQETQEEQIDYEKEALEMGWNPNYDGPNKKSAQEYYEDGLKIQPILQANLKKERQKVEELQSQLLNHQSNTEKSILALQKHFERETQRKINEIQEGKLQAVKNADEEAFKRLDAEEKELLKTPQPKAEPNYSNDPTFKQWKTENSWYGTDQDLTNYADWYSNKIRPTTDKKGREFLDLVAEQVRKQFKDKFKNPRKENYSAASPSTRSQPSKTTSFDSLPSSAKRDFDYMVNRGLMENNPSNREQFAKDWTEAAQ